MAPRDWTERGRADPWQPVRPGIDDGTRAAGGRARDHREPRTVRGTIEDLPAAVRAAQADEAGEASGRGGGARSGALIEFVVLDGARILGGELAGPRLRDILIDQAVLAGVVVDGGGGVRVHVRGGRVSGTGWIRGEFHDVLLEQVRADGLTLRFCTLHRVRFTGCDLSGLDLTGTRLDHVRFEDCDLREAVFTQTRVAAASFTGCRFDGASGVAGLAGAEVDTHSVMTLVGPMAAELEISVV